MKKQQNISNQKGDPTRKSDFCVFVYSNFRDIFIFVKNNPKVKGLKILEREFLYTAYVDDTTFFLKDRKSIIELMNGLNTFFKFLRIKT